jgi:hypothetical protein
MLLSFYIILKYFVDKHKPICYTKRKRDFTSQENRLANAFVECDPEAFVAFFVYLPIYYKKKEKFEKIFKKVKNF